MVAKPVAEVLQYLCAKRRVFLAYAQEQFMAYTQAKNRTNSFCGDRIGAGIQHRQLAKQCARLCRCKLSFCSAELGLAIENQKNRARFFTLRDDVFPVANSCFSAAKQSTCMATGSQSRNMGNSLKESESALMLIFRLLPANPTKDQGISL